MCFYKPNAPPCICTFYELLQPCRRATFYPSPKPQQNPNPIIRVCGVMNVTLAAVSRHCLVCESAAAFTADSAVIPCLGSDGADSLSAQNQHIGSYNDRCAELDCGIPAMAQNFDSFSSLGHKAETETVASGTEFDALSDDLLNDFGSLLPDYGDVQSLVESAALSKDR
ncbi:hypothetical protein NFIA_064060 [Paecilomyces variotii No. 5]|uniref:Uncharacterized protein n=1 Tax=Byssochlamys spectabilis (strain No. 5 / NBRC 109023) TaxID=1356009 RepID=V5G7B3_BYSSN|nr:hypothetical protein NFIA_064060 [Paecilomyces variotii No. 5]